MSKGTITGKLIHSSLDPDTVNLNAKPGKHFD
jgi:hypothetical protein